MDLGQVSSTMRGEKGRKDNFDKAFPDPAEHYYIGKNYNNASEVLSMGLQKMYRDPINFAKQDPEYFKFVLGICDGSLLKHRWAGPKGG